MADYRGVSGDTEVEMNWIEDQINNCIRELEIPSELQILEKDNQFFDLSLPRIQIKLPTDLIARYQIDKVAKQVAYEGYQFEEELKRIILKRKQVDSPALYQVFSRSDEDLYNYYRWRTLTYFNGDSSESWS